MVQNVKFRASFLKKKFVLYLTKILSDLAGHHLLCGPQECVGEKGRFFADCTSEFGLRELTGYSSYQRFAPVGVRHDWSSVSTLAPYGGLLFATTSESAGDSDCDEHDVVAGLRTWVQVNSDVSDKLAV